MVHSLFIPFESKFWGWHQFCSVKNSDFCPVLIKVVLVCLTLCCLPVWISSSMSSPCPPSVTHYLSGRCYHPNHPPTRSLSLNDTADNVANLLGRLPCTTLYSVLSLQSVCKVHDKRTVCFIILAALLECCLFNNKWRKKPCCEPQITRSCKWKKKTKNNEETKRGQTADQCLIYFFTTQPCYCV